MKQSIEKAFEESWLNDYYHGNYKEHAQVGFYAGAEWQAEQSPWIKAKDKLPDACNGSRSKPVLVMLTEGKTELLEYENCLHKWCPKDDFFYDVSDDDLWMTIPKLM